MPQPLVFADRDSAADALTFAGRAARLAEDAVRLQAAGGVLAMTAPVLLSRGGLDTCPTVLGMRVLAVDPEVVCDLVIRASELRADPSDSAALALPEQGLTAAWAGVSAPRGKWEAAGQVAASALAARAQWGIAAVAEGVPRDGGEDLVRAVRTDVWGRRDDALGMLHRGAAFAAFALGFIGGEEQATVSTNGPWTRVTLRRGHVLTREAIRVGFTAVRTAGS